MRKSITERFFAKVNKTDGCWLWTGCHSNGRGRFSHNGSPQFAYRVSWQIHNGPIPEGLFVCHSCDNGLCVNPKHLWLGTQFDNMRDCATKGRLRMPRARGSTNGAAVLDEQSVVAIRTQHANGAMQTTLAKQYGVHITTINLVVHRKIWKHV
jgi:hypothetical protein